jgi:hypothetical protein
MSGRPGWLKARRGGKSELFRARRSITRSGGNPKESATERETVPAYAGIRVKR